MKTIHSLSTTENTARFILAASIVCAFTFTACERKTTAEEPTAPASPATQTAEPIAKTSTFETARLGGAIDRFEKTPTVENQASVKLAFTELDGEIAELELRVTKTHGSARAEAAAKAANLQKYRDSEMVRFTKAQIGTAFETTPPADSRSGAQKMKDTAVKVGDTVEDGAEKVGKTLEKGAKNTGEAIKEATH